jgi:hypothetical protein
MAINTTGSTPGQIVQATQAATTQLNLRQMAGEVQAWNPDAPQPLIERWLNNAYRSIIDFRNWYGLVARGQISVPQVYATGQVTVTNGSATVVGTGTAFTSAMVGRQFRIGFSSPIYTIVTVSDPTHMDLDLPWGDVTTGPSGYSIFQQLVNLGSNVRRIISILNVKQGYRLRTDVSKMVLDAKDAWRTQQGYTRVCASWGPDTAGNAIWELWPIPTAQQALPYLVYVQPPDMNDANPFPYPYIRADVIVLRAISDALLFRGKTSKYYDPVTAQVKLAQFAQELQKMSDADDNLLMKNLIWEYSNYSYFEGDAAWFQAHDTGYPT